MRFASTYIDLKGFRAGPMSGYLHTLFKYLHVNKCMYCNGSYNHSTSVVLASGLRNICNLVKLELINCTTGKLEFFFVAMYLFRHERFAHSLNCFPNVCTTPFVENIYEILHTSLLAIPGPISESK